MIWEIVKLKLRTIYTQPLLVLMFLVLAIDFMVGLFESLTAPLLVRLDSPLANFGVEILSFYFLLYSLFPANRYLVKSDIDFLFMLPVDERDIVIALSITSFIFNLSIMATLILLTAPVLTFGSFIVIILFSLLISFIGNILYKFTLQKRVIISSLMALWFFSAYFNFPLSPLSMFKGYVIGYPVLITFTVLVIFLALRKISIEDLVRANMSQTLRALKGSLNLYSTSPIITMLRKNLNIMELGGRVGAGGGQYVVARIRVYYVFLAMVALAVVTYLLKAVFIPIFIEFLIIVNFAQASFVNEALWLNLSVMQPLQYARKYLFTKLLTLYILFSPIALAEILSGNLSIGVSDLIFPLSFIYLSSVLARVYPTTQYGGQVLNVKRYLFSTLGVVPVIVIMYLSILFPLYILIGILVLNVPFLLSESFWEKSFEKVI